jgi:hypothetical protein
MPAFVFSAVIAVLAQMVASLGRTGAGLRGGFGRQHLDLMSANAHVLVGGAIVATALLLLVACAVFAHKLWAFGRATPEKMEIENKIAQLRGRELAEKEAKDLAAAISRSTGEGRAKARDGAEASRSKRKALRV